MTNIIKSIIGESVELPVNGSSVDIFLRSLHTAAKCRFNAAIRLKQVSTFSFATATTLSLGLIFLPLMQLANVKLYINNQLLNVFQIFLAVSVLVYSVINSKSRYDLRAKKINKSGDQIKKIARELESYISTQPERNKVDYESYRKRYECIEVDIENHTLLDYDFARLNMPRYYRISGFKRLWIFSKCMIKILYVYSVPLLIIVFELCVILFSVGAING